MDDRAGESHLAIMRSVAQPLRITRKRDTAVMVQSQSSKGQSLMHRPPTLGPTLRMPNGDRNP